MESIMEEEYMQMFSGEKQMYMIFNTPDSHQFLVPRELALCSRYMTIFINKGDDRLLKYPVQLPHVEGETFKRVLTYLVHHVYDNDTFGERAESGYFKFTEWDMNFILALNDDENFKLLKAAYHLGIMPLLALSHHSLNDNREPTGTNLDVTSGIFREINPDSLWKYGGP